jgi:UDP-glucuronate decarboxylase
MRVLITGAAGFLGSHLVDWYLKHDHMVIGIDNLSTGSIENLSGALTNQNFRFLEMDVTTPYSFDVDLILNFACPASPVHYQLTPIETLKTSILGTLNALELCRETGARLVQASTSEVYGDPDVSPQKEDYVGRVNPNGPRACYDEGKRAAETAIYDYIRIYDLDVRVMRIFNTYGPRMAIDDGRVVSNFLVAALNGDPITIYGDGLQTRSFCYVSDTISGAIAIASTSERPISPVNIGNPHEMTMLELAQQSLRLTSSTSLLEFHELPIDDPKQRCPDISLAKGILEWYPKVELIEGLTQTADYFRRVLGK